MPKMKTKRAAAKRSKRTAVRHAQAAAADGSGTSSRAKRPKRQAPSPQGRLVAKADQPRLDRLVPYL